MHVLVRYRVDDFEDWKEAFDEREEIRHEHGWKGGSLFTRADSKGRVVLLAEWDSAESVENYFESTEFRRAMRDASVTSKPDVTLLKHVEDVGGPAPAEGCDEGPAEGNDSDDGEESV